ncbi:MAG: hypothetical protein NTX50_12060 [Candidatus Sumerlaeota bacterium]|nr:hypothetical protein [Candidatus Sumerlaeota bacterium]
MKSREKILLAVTIVSLLGFFGFRMGWQSYLLTMWKSISVSESAIKDAEKEAQRVQEYLNREAVAREVYNKRVVQSMPMPKGDKSAEAQFTEDIEGLCKNAGIILNRIDPAQREAISDTKDWEFITVGVNYRKEWSGVVQLLKNFDKNFLLIKELNIASPPDKDYLSVDIRLARVVALTKEEKQKREDEKTKKKGPAAAAAQAPR